MGHPAAPLTLLLLLLPSPAAPSTPPAPPAPPAPCFPLPTATPAELDLTNRSQRCSELDLGPFERQSRLVLSSNGIEALSPASRLAPGLQELDLSHNRLRDLPPALLSRARGLRLLLLQHNLLRDLPDGFFANATALERLRLDGNPLSAVPASAFQPGLRLLAVPCRCDAVGSVLAPCACPPPACAAPRCQCHTSRGDAFNVTDFHGRECGRSAGLAAGLAGAVGGAAALLAVAAAVWYRRRKAAAGGTGAGWGKRESAAGHGQPRYISRAAEVGAAEVGAAEVGTAEMGTAAGSTAPDYENVFVSPRGAPGTARGWAPGWQEQRHSPPCPPDDDYFLESEAGAGDQPIYANTQGPEEDNLYIIPDRG